MKTLKKILPFCSSLPFYKGFLALAFALFLCCSVGVGQNLVPNPSFEDTVSCPFGSEELDKALGWINCSSADYFNVCANPFDSGVPNNFGGYQMPASGNAYAGFLTYSPDFSNIREFIACNFSTPLAIGTKYYISFKVALSLNSMSLTNYASALNPQVIVKKNVEKSVKLTL